MPVALDANYLVAWLQPENLDVPEDPATGAPIEKLVDRIQYLMSQLEANTERIVIPTPVLAEFLVHAGPAGAPFVALLNKNRNFRLAEFGRRAAIETAEILRKELETISKAQQHSETRGKAKFDMQIVAIAKVEGVSRIFSNDQGLANRCRRQGLVPVPFHELPLPPDDLPPLFKYANDQK